LEPQLLLEGVGAPGSNNGPSATLNSVINETSLLSKAVLLLPTSVIISSPCRNSGDGHWNHSFFWKVLGAPGFNNGPSAALKSAIDKSFGSLDELKAKFITYTSLSLSLSLSVGRLLN
jgi:superoxide dismutase